MTVVWVGTFAIVLKQIKPRYGLRFTTVILQMTPDMINRGPRYYFWVRFCWTNEKNRSNP